jgi:hypothetical protein
MTQASRDRTEYVEISGTAAERAAFNNPKQAMEWYETDTTARYKYMSGAWVNLTPTGGAAPGYGGGGGPSDASIGQQRATAAVVALPNVPLKNGVAICASTKNVGNIMCGLAGTLTAADDGTGTGYELNPGQPFPGLAITNLNQLAIIAATGNTSTTDFISYVVN